MKASVEWKNRMSFSGEADSGFSIPLGTATEVGGDNDGFKPMELLLIGLAGCTAMDVISILTKKRQQVDKFTVSIDAERAEDHPKIFTNILITYSLCGRDLDRAAVERAVELSETKYCPAQAIMSKSAEIRHIIQINNN